jgi:hypothetical protein
MKPTLPLAASLAVVFTVSACSPTTVTQGDFLEKIETTTQAYLADLDGSAVKVVDTRTNPSGDVLRDGQFVFNPDQSALGQVVEQSPITASTVTIEIACVSATECVERTQGDWAPSGQPLPKPSGESFTEQALQVLADNPPAGDVTYLLDTQAAEMTYTSRAGVEVSFGFARAGENLATVTDVGGAVTTVVASPLDPQPLPSDVLNVR